MANNFPGKVLYIDDDEDARNLYGDALKKAGYQVDFSVTGSDGYAKILQGGYDIILMDMMMPDLNGTAVLKAIQQKKLEAEKNGAPQETNYYGSIIILSQVDQPQIIDEVFKLGAKGYLVKANLEPAELTAKISRILQSSK